MDINEKDAICSIFCTLIQDIQLKYLKAPLIQYRVLALEDCEHFDSPGQSDSHKTEKIVIHMIKNCTLDIFLEILRYNGTYDHLADIVEETVSRWNETGSKYGHSRVNSFHDTKPNRINIFTGSRKKVKHIAHLLKRLIHFGQLEEFEKNVKKIKNKWDFVRNNPQVSPGAKAETADLVFTVLDCQLANMRIKNAPNMYNHRFFDDMIKIIPYTSNPILSSMSYTARFGATVILQEPLDHGLAHLMTAKMHSEMLVPCKEAGMVYYQEIDILVRKYEIETSEAIKNDMLSRYRLALNQFNEETSVVKEDFTRMLFLRMANIYLGINVFGSVIANVKVSKQDLKEAENCLKMVKATWNGMDLRRKMFYYVAKAVFNQNRNRPDIALVKSKLAMELANEGNFKSEKPSIELLIQKFEYEFSSSSDREKELTANELESIMSNDDEDDGSNFS